MIVKEFYMTSGDGVNLYRTYSNENFEIRQVQTGAIYDEAIDVEGSKYTYEEVTEPSETELSETELKAKAYDIIIGEVE